MSALVESLAVIGNVLFWQILFGISFIIKPDLTPDLICLSSDVSATQSTRGLFRPAPRFLWFVLCLRPLVRRFQNPIARFFNAMTPMQPSSTPPPSLSPLPHVHPVGIHSIPSTSVLTSVISMPPSPRLHSSTQVTPSFPTSRRTVSDDSLRSDDGSNVTLQCGRAITSSIDANDLLATSTTSPTLSHNSSKSSQKCPMSSNTSSSSVSPAPSLVSSSHPSSDLSLHHYVRHNGSSIMHDINDNHTQTIPRSHLRRTYSSSDEEPSTRPAVEVNVALTTTASKHRNAIDVGITTSILTENDFQHFACDKWARDVDDQLSLEESHLEEDSSSAASSTKSLETTMPTSAEKEQSVTPKRRPRGSDMERTNRSEMSNSEQSSSSLKTMNDTEIPRILRNERTIQQRVAHLTQHDAARRPCNNTLKRDRLLRRVKLVANELAKLQVTTASQAADIDGDYHHVADETRDVQHLRAELRTLRITLDRLAHLALKEAYVARDTMENHR